MSLNSRPLPEILRQTGPITSRKQRIRASVLLINNNKQVYLLNNLIDGKEVWFLPGGSVDWGETIKDAAVREAKEELGIDVIPTQLIGVSDAISPNKDFHSIELIFKCNYVGHPIPNGEIPDTNEITENKYGIAGRWFTIDEIANFNAYPKLFLTKKLPALINGNEIIETYIGLDWD